MTVVSVILASELNRGLSLSKHLTIPEYGDSPAEPLNDNLEYKRARQNTVWNSLRCDAYDSPLVETNETTS